MKKTPVKLGADLSFDVENEEFTGSMSYEANMFLSRNYREPFVLPESL